MMNDELMLKVVRKIIDDCKIAVSSCIPHTYYANIIGRYARITPLNTHASYASEESIWAGCLLSLLIYNPLLLSVPAPVLRWCVLKVHDDLAQIGFTHEWRKIYEYWLYTDGADIDRQ